MCHSFGVLLIASTLLPPNGQLILSINFMHKLAQNIKSDSKSFYAYERSKQNVRDKFGPLEENAGNKITQGFLMAEE